MINLMSSNTRLLYSSKALTHSIFTRLEGVDNYLRSSSAFELANSSIVIYSDASQKLRVGREVTGFDTQLDLQEDLAFCDYILGEKENLGQFSVSSLKDLAQISTKHQETGTIIRFLIDNLAKMIVKADKFKV